MHPAEIANELRKYPFFSGFPKEALVVFATMAVPREFDDKSLLLEQGRENDSLFFLRTGMLQIQVDHETVFELSKPGEVIGEMSLINRRPVTASVVAKGKVQVFQVSESHLSTLPQKDLQQFQQFLYKVYAGVLTDRLEKTNEKAKKFEIANRELEMAHLTLRKVNESLETEINRRSNEMVQKVKSLTETHLGPVHHSLMVWSQDENLKVSAEDHYQAGRLVGEVIDFFKPMLDLNEKLKSRERRRVLLCDPNKKQQLIARLALGGTGVELLMVSSLDELSNVDINTHLDLILCEAELEQCAQKIKQLWPETPLAILVSSDMDKYLQTIKNFPDAHFFVTRDINNRLFTIKSISTTVAKILNQDFFGIEKYLAWGTQVSSISFRDSETRANIIEQMKDHLQKMGLRSAVLDRVHTATEELLMNAVYDAPVDLKGKHIYNHMSRQEQVVLRPEHEATLSYATDGVLLAVSVSDPFGALSKEIIMSYLDSCYSGRAGEFNRNKGGAGRGLHMIVESSDLTVFNISRRKKTEVISLYNLDKGNAESSKPTFHLFIE